MKMLIFMPCLNEAETIGQVIKRIPKSIPYISAMQILVVDDGSTDASADIAAAKGAKVIRNLTNRGVGYCMQIACRYAVRNRFDLMVNIDSDGQFAPEDIPRLVEPVLHGSADFCSASRFLDQKNPIENMSWVKFWGNQKMTGLINRLTRRNFTDVSCGFRAYGREALLRINLHGEFTYTQETYLSLAFQGLRIEEIPVAVKYFSDRKSRVAGNIFAYAIRTSKIIFRTYRDYMPMRFFASIAFTLFAISSVFLGFLAFWWITHQRFSPHIWSGFVGAAFGFSGLLCLIFALLADMNSRIRRNQEELLYLAKSMNPHD